MTIKVLGYEWIRLLNMSSTKVEESPYLVSVESTAGRLVLVRVEQNVNTGEVLRRPVAALDMPCGRFEVDEYGVWIR